LGFFAVSAALAQDAVPKANDKTPATGEARVAIAHMFRAHDLIGLNVRNKANENIGSVNDLVVDMKSGEVRYVAVSHGGVAGVGGKLFAVPWDAMTFQMGEPNKADSRFFVFDVTKEQLDNAKGFDTSHWPNVGDAQWAKTAGKTKEHSTVKDVTTGERPTVVYETVFRASKIDGLDVQNDAKEDLGDLNDIMIDVTKGMVKYVILSHGTILTGGNRLFAVPLSQITLAHANDKTFVKFNVSEDALKNAPNFTSNSWPKASDKMWTDVDSHYDRTARRESTRP
jgi:sporulation protein YlmC with PRC-barrel domain